MNEHANGQIERAIAVCQELGRQMESRLGLRLMIRNVDFGDNHKSAVECRYSMVSRDSIIILGEVELKIDMVAHKASVAFTTFKELCDAMDDWTFELDDVSPETQHAVTGRGENPATILQDGDEVKR